MRKYMRKLRSLKHLLKNTSYRWQNSCAILIYHRVNSLESDPQMLAVTPKKFEDQIRYLKSSYNVISLQELVNHLIQGKIPKKSVVITFDDGYADNLYNAKPILEKYEVPATVFVTGGMIDSSLEYWWDELERIFLVGDCPFKPLELIINEKEYNWNISTQLDAVNVYNQIHPLLKEIPATVREKIILNLFQWADLRREGRLSHRSLTSDEVKELAKGGLIEIGAHTMTHCVLSVESASRQEWEIKESKKVLEKMLGNKIKSFSYPFGSILDATPETRLIVKKNDFNCGIANESGNVYADSNILWLHRRLIRNWDLNEFQRNLDDFFTTPRDLLDFFGERFFNGNLVTKAYQQELVPKVKNYPPVRKNGNLTKVLHINTLDSVGGAARVAYDLNRSLLKRNIHSVILADRVFSEDDNIEVLLRDNSYRQKLLWNTQQRNGWLDFFHLSSFTVTSLESFKNADILHLHNLHGDYFSLFALPELTALKPTVWTLHDMQSFTGHCAHSLDCPRWETGCGSCPDLNVYPCISKDTTGFLWDTKKEIYDHSHLTIVCPSRWLKEKVEKSILKNKDIRLIYNGINEKVFKDIDKISARKQLGLPEEKSILLFSAHGGTENSWKGGRYLVNLCEHLNHREDVFFLNVGGSKKEYKDNNWLNVPYVTNEEEMALYYSAADLFIYPSLADNCPLVVLESLSCGTPVIAFRTGGIPELVRHLETGYIAEYKNEQDFLRGVTLFLDNPTLRNKAAAEGRSDVINNFTVNKMTESYVDLYHELLYDLLNGR